MKLTGYLHYVWERVTQAVIPATGCAALGALESSGSACITERVQGQPWQLCSGKMKAKAVPGVQAVGRTVVLHVALYLVSQTLTTQLFLPRHLPSVCKCRNKHQVLPSSPQPGNAPRGGGGESRACLLLLPFHFFPLLLF